VVDPDLELREGGGGLDFLVLLAFFLSVISSFFTQNKGGGGTGPPCPSPGSATEIICRKVMHFSNYVWLEHTQRTVPKESVDLLKLKPETS